MNITVDKQPECTATLRAEIPAEKVQSEPVSVIEKRFADDIKAELESRLISAACSEAMQKDSELKVLNFKNPEAVEFADGGDFSFTMPLILAPEFEIPEYKDIEISVASADATDEELQREIDGLLERYADYSDIEDRALATDDIAVIDFTSTLDGKPLEEAIGKPVGVLAGKEDYWVQLKEDAFLPGFAKQLEGAAKDETREVTSSVGDDFPLEDLHGKEIVFSVTVKAIKEQKLPELNDEFVAETIQLGPDKTVDDLKDLISEQITMQKQKQIEEDKVNQIVETLIDRVDFALPQDLVDQEAQGSADEMVARGAQSGLSEEQIAAQHEEIAATAQTQAKNNLKTNFILQEIAMKEKIEVDDQDMIQRISAMAQQANTPVKKYIKELQKANAIQNVRNSVLIGKTIDFVVEKAIVTEVAATETPEKDA